MKSLLIALLSLFIFSCSQSSTDKKYGIETMVIVYDYEAQKYKVIETRIPTLTTQKKIDNKIAQFFYKTASNINLNYENSIKLNLATTSDGLHLPEDIQTLNAVSGYYSYDRLYSFHKKLGVLNRSRWPKKVNIEAINSKGIINNAFHNPSINNTHYLPFEKGHVPTHLNLGIVAHEENHGIFYEQVTAGVIDNDVYFCAHEFAKYNYFKSNICQGFFNLDIETAAANQAILRSLDEGFADYAGFLITNASDFMYASLGFESRHNVFHRHISDKLIDGIFPSTEAVNTTIKNIITQREVPTSANSQFSRLSGVNTLNGFSYAMAGQVSSLLNMLSANIIVPEEESKLNKKEFMYKMIVENLPKLKELVRVKYLNSKITYQQILNLLLDRKHFEGTICMDLIKLMGNVSDPLEMCDTQTRGF